MNLCFHRKVLESERQRDGEPDRARDEDDPSLSGGELDLHRQLDLQALLPVVTLAKKIISYVYELQTDKYDSCDKSVSSS